MNIRLFSNKLRIAMPKVKPGPNQMALPFDVSKAPDISSLNSPITGPIYNEHNDPKDNIFHDLEGPQHHSLGISKSNKVQPVGMGITSSKFHYGNNGKIAGVVKGDSNSFLKEPLVHQIGEHIQKGFYPNTVIRNHQHEAFQPGYLTPHSFQEFSPGKMDADLSPRENAEFESHPHHAAVRAMDWLTGNKDRHDYNVIYNKNHPDPLKQVSAIDNGGAFYYNNNYDDIPYSYHKVAPLLLQFDDHDLLIIFWLDKLDLFHNKHNFLLVYRTFLHIYLRESYNAYISLHGST